MAHFSLWIKTNFIMLAFCLCSDAVLSQLPDVMTPPNCDTYPDPPFSCTYDSDPICATDKKTYGNPCAFCFHQKQSNPEITFSHWGQC
ncbi:ovomucoid-like isoform X2 [Rhinopithecus roxellana]|uniref:ovomucoid-like isoform X2 n=1 Tax=Rhinopithecus roxellana TaxID=61622 RepID=UPI0005332F73|nr:ovomucoid-like isoform X2 [Rhinopithecus roxellana]